MDASAVWKERCEKEWRLKIQRVDVWSQRIISLVEPERALAGLRVAPLSRVVNSRAFELSEAQNFLRFEIWRYCHRITSQREHPT